MFIDICHDVAKRNSYFQRTSNAAGLSSFATIQKVTVAIWILGYGGSADRLDEYIRMGESTTLETVNKFTRTIVAEYGHIYLREHNAQDIARLLHIAEEWGFPEMLGSIDCMHWEWSRGYKVHCWLCNHLTQHEYFVWARHGVVANWRLWGSHTTKARSE
jgi:hypothetical protein